MKTQSFRPLFAVLCGLLLCVLCVSLVPTAAAQAADTAITLAPDTASAVAWYANPTLWASAIAVLTGMFGIWQNREKTTAQKINQSLILGIEEASRLPGVADKEKQIKSTIKEWATSHGVQPLLDRLVKDLT